MVRETQDVPHIFGHRTTDDRLFPEIAGIGTVVIPLHGSSREALFAKSGHATRQLLVVLGVRRHGLPERWLERLAIKLVEGDGSVVLDTTLCRVTREKPCDDGFIHLYAWTYPVPVSVLILTSRARILLRSPSGHEWSGPASPLLRAA